MTVLYQDTDIILLDPYTWTGEADKKYLKVKHFSWMMSTVGNDYKVLLNRLDRSVIQITNEFYQDRYSTLEPSLTGDVLILGAGLQTLDAMLVTGSSWKWVEINPYLASIIPSNGTIHEGDAEDIDFLQSLGSTFDTILIDFPIKERMDFSSIMNVGANIIYFKL